jgi:hypothetical protein
MRRNADLSRFNHLRLKVRSFDPPAETHLDYIRSTKPHTMDLGYINWLAVIVATLAAFFPGFLWYSV